MQSHIKALRSKKNDALYQLQTLTSSELISVIKHALASNDTDKLNLAESLLISLADSNPSIAAELKQLIKEHPEHESHLIWLLAEMATPESLSTIISLINEESLSEPAAQSLALVSIADIGKKRSTQGNFRTELTAVLLPELQQLDFSSDLFKAAATGLGSIGDTQGITALLSTAKNNPDNANVQHIVERALMSTRNLDAIKPLAEQLDFIGTDPIALIAGNALANMGKSQATQVLLDWAGKLEHNNLDTQVISWMQQIRDPESVSLILNSADKLAFKNPELLSQIQQTVEQKHQQATPVITQ